MLDDSQRGSIDMVALTSIPRFLTVIRVFVSSTSSDLKPERNPLQARVFPSWSSFACRKAFSFPSLRYFVDGDQNTPIA
jgi:hypothetical protein